MRNERPASGRRRLSLLTIASYLGIAAGALVLVCALAVLLFSDAIANRFIKPRIEKAFVEAYPAYSIRIANMTYSVVQNRFGFDSVALRSVDSTFSGTLGPVSVSGVAWTHLLWGGSLEAGDCANSVLEVQDIVMNFLPSQYELRCKRIHVSMADSTMAADSLAIHPSVSDEQFFQHDKFRKTRFNLVAPQCRVTGVSCLELMQGTMYRTRAVRIHDVFIDILIDKDKPNRPDTSRVLMPNEIFSSMETALQVDSLSVMNGRMRYGERFIVGATPSLITFDSIELLAEGITSRGAPGAAIGIHAQGQFMKAGTMKVRMTIPVASPEFSLRYSGSLSGMKLSALNSHLGPSDQMRVNAGVLQGATFEIDVASGRASGNVRAVYTDLTLAAINKRTGSEAGLFDVIMSYIANTYTIRRTNVPDASGEMKIGTVRYTRKGDDPFFGFVWSALRSGVQDVVGW